MVIGWLWLSGAAALGAEPGRYALLVGVGAYDRSPSVAANERWQVLDGAKHDVDGMKSVLERRGFEVETLLDDQATGDAIRAAFARHLVGRARAGDVALFYFSGHGQQVTDRDGDEVDGLDESLVPFDSLGRVNASKQLLDDELAVMLGRLREKTDNTVVIFDSCYSGSATRSAGNPTLRARGLAPGQEQHPPATTARSAQDEVNGLLETDTGYVFLSAANAHQRAWETRDAQGYTVGVFTSALVAALDEVPRGATYRTWHQVARVMMQAAPAPQDPQLQGDADKKLFSDEWGSDEAWYALNLEEGRLRVEAGSMHGIGEGTEFGLFPPGDDPLNPRAAKKAKVTELHPAWSIVEGDASDWPRGGRAMELVASHAASSLALHLEDARDLARGFERIPGVQLAEADAATVTLTRVGSDLQLQLEDTSALPIPTGAGKPMVDRVSAKAPDREHLLTQALKLEIRRRRVAGLSNGQSWSRLPARLEVRKVEVVNPRLGAKGEIEWDAMTELGEISRDRTDRVQPGTIVQFTVHNDAAVDAHMAILETSTDGSVLVLWPSKDAGFENRVAAGKSATIRMPFRLTEPPGRQVWKLVASDHETDFSGLEMVVRGGASRGAVKGAGTALGQLIMDTIEPSRGTEALLAPVDMKWGTDQVAIEVADAE